MNENENVGQDASNVAPTEEQVNEGIANIANEEAGTDGEVNTNADAPADANADAPSNESEEVSEVPTAKYKITGLVDTTDEQGNINGQLEVGSEQVLPVEIGDRAVEAGQAERIEE